MFNLFHPAKTFFFWYHFPWTFKMVMSFSMMSVLIIPFRIWQSKNGSFYTAAKDAWISFMLAGRSFISLQL